MHWIKTKWNKDYNQLSNKGLVWFAIILASLIVLFGWNQYFILKWCLLGLSVLQMIGVILKPILRTEFALLSLITFPIGWIMGYVVTGIIYFLIVLPIAIFKKQNYESKWHVSKEIDPTKMYEG